MTPGTTSLGVALATALGAASASFAGTPCFIWPPCDGTSEGEPCDQVGPDNFNGGCNSTPDAFSDTSLESTICGTLWAHDGNFDADWWRFHVPYSENLGIRVKAEIDTAVFVARLTDGGTCPVIGVPSGDIAYSNECNEYSGIGQGYVLDPGDYILFVYPSGPNGGGIYDGFPCPDGIMTNNAYEICFGHIDGCGYWTPQGACCLDQVCSNEFYRGCEYLGGTFLGVGTTCEESACAAVTGACCGPGGFCAVGFESDCDAFGGMFQGLGTFCELANCAGCAEDLSGNGQVDFADMLAVIGALGPCPPMPPCPADLSGNGDEDFADVLAVINAWGACPSTS